MSKRRLLRLARPLIRWTPRGKGLLFRVLGGWTGDWTDHPHRTLDDRTIPAQVPLDLREVVDRMHYFYGQYFLPLNRLLIRRFLGPGDTYVDFGAHHGIFTATAARTVGPSGRVVSFEPNPDSYRRIIALLQLNAIENVTVHNLALSDAAGTLRLAQPSGTDSDCCTIRPLGALAASSVEVDVKRADSVLTDLPTTGRILYKIDTEGFEHHVIRGMGTLLDRPNIGCIVEVTGPWLRDCGSSAHALFADMKSHGFKPYLPRQIWKGTRQALEITHAGAPPNDSQQDVLFAKPEFFML